MRALKSARLRGCIGWALCLTALGSPSAHAATEIAAAAKETIAPRAVGEGPYSRLVLRNLIMVDGTGAPATGPVDITLSQDRIADIRYRMAPGTVNSAANAPADRTIDLDGYYVLPGFVDMHAHLHSLADGQGVPADYVLKLWLAHGITTIRELGNKRPLEWLTDIQARSARNEIVAPRIHTFPFFHMILPRPITDAATARVAVRTAKQRGAMGLKFISAPRDVLFAALDEAEKLGMPTTMHHAQSIVASANVQDTTAHGLDSIEHWYGIPEAMFTDRTIQDWPDDFIYDDEQARFFEAAHLWAQTSAPGSPTWNTLIDRLLERNVTLDPTFVAYLANRDLMRMRRAIWHDEYTLPALWDWYRPSKVNHGSYWFDWTSTKEITWRRNYALWMRFVNDYKNRGGLVTVGSDSGYLYNLYGFGYVQELELLQEAGFSPLEVIRAATESGAKALGQEQTIGTIAVGKKADLVIVRGNPLANLKLLFGTGTMKLDETTGNIEPVGGIHYTVKDGILYDARQLREEIRAMVAAQKAERGILPGPMPIAARYQNMDQTSE